MVLLVVVLPRWWYGGAACDGAAAVVLLPAVVVLPVLTYSSASPDLRGETGRLTLGEGACRASLIRAASAPHDIICELSCRICRLRSAVGFARACRASLIRVASTSFHFNAMARSTSRAWRAEEPATYCGLSFQC